MIQPPIDIDEQYINEILRPVGYPVLTLDDDDFELSEEDIKTLCVLPAMREYFRWFPLIEEANYTISGEFSVDFPDSFVFGVTDARLNRLPRGGSTTNNPFVNERFFSQSRAGAYGTKNDYDLTIARIYERYEKQSFVNVNSAFAVRLDQNNRRLHGYTTISGEMLVTWARWDNQFSKIPYNKLDEVIKLSQSYLLETLGMIRGQMNQGLDVDYNYQLFLDKAETLKEEILSNWKAHTKPIVLRG
jgi:hypothetical protein